MFYEDLFVKKDGKPVTACLMGAGEFGASFVTQAAKIPNLDLVACCSLDVEQAIQAFLASGIARDNIEVASTKEEAKLIYEKGHKVICTFFDIICELGTDVLIESSGSPNASAHAAELAIENGMHVVMASKETESVVGPILNKKARDKGLVFTSGDGDQPSILIGLISWARVLGLKILAAGKSSEYDFVYDPTTHVLTCNGQKVAFECKDLEKYWYLGDTPACEIAKARLALLEDKLSLRANPDLCEMVLVSNATGFVFDKDQFNAPVARISELADFFSPKEDGGLLSGTPRLDIFNCLRKPDELSMAGGEFIIVECEDQKIWKVLEAKGHVLSRNGKYAALYIPRHIMGLETATSVMAAATLSHSTSGKRVQPITDMYGYAKTDLKAGTVLKMGGHHHTIDEVVATTGLTKSLSDSNPVPFYLMSNAVLKKDVKEGELIRLEHVTIDENSTLFRLRKEQDKVFDIK